MERTGNKMLTRLLQHFLKTIALLAAVSILAFTLVSASPMNPVQQYLLRLGTTISPEKQEQLQSYWDVEKPPIQQYLGWLGKMLEGNLGESLLYRRPVSEILNERFFSSFALMLCAWCMAGILGFSLGCLMGMYHGRWQDKILKKLCYLLSTLPGFWLGLVFLLIFAVWLGWFPIGFSSPIGVTSQEVTIWQKLHHLILPAFTLSILSFGKIALHTREKLVDVLSSPYVLFARARGEGSWQAGFY